MPVRSFLGALASYAPKCRALVPFACFVASLAPGWGTADAQGTLPSPACLAPRSIEAPCGFYSECLEASRPCEATRDAYALSYGQKYCSRFTGLAEGGTLTPQGRAWVEETRSCLQEALVDDLPGGLRAGGTCADLRARAFDSHPFCYLTSGRGFCRLPLQDYPRILALYELPDMVGLESLRQMGQVLDGCIKRWTGLESPAGDHTRRLEVLGEWRGRLASREAALIRAGATRQGNAGAGRGR